MESPETQRHNGRSVQSREPALLLAVGHRQFAVTVDLLPPERRHFRTVRAEADLSMIEGRRIIDDADVLEVIEKNQGAETRLICGRSPRQGHIELARSRPLHEHSVLIHHTPNETGAIEAF